MKKRFIKFHFKQLKPILIFLTIVSLITIMHGADSEDVKGKVIARVVYSFPHALPGEKIEIKRILTYSGKIITVSSSEEYKSIGDIQELKRVEGDIIRQQYGKISGNLINVYDLMSDSDYVKVTIQFKHEVTEEQLNKLNLTPNRIKIDNLTVVDSVSKVLLKSIKSNSIIYQINKYFEPIPLSGGDENCRYCIPNIDSVYTGDAYSRSFFNLPYDVDSMPGWARGSFVNIATFEDGIRDSMLNYIIATHPGLDIGHIDKNTSDKDYNRTHSEMCFHAMLHTAPNAKLFHFLSGLNLDLIHNHNIEVASRSTLVCYSNHFDSLTYTSSPNNSAVIVAGTGNFGVGFAVNTGQPYSIHRIWYNNISAGGCVYTNNEYYEIANDGYWELWPGKGWRVGSVYSQTQTRNSSVNTFSDKEVPHIVGPTRTTCAEVGGRYERLHGFSGTSAGAPSIVGICACVISANPHLMSNNTENVRTALMVTAENIDGGYWDPMVDGRDGCGVVSGYSAAMFAHNVTRKDTSSPADTMGLAFGVINNTTQVGTRLKFNVRAPSIFPDGKHFRAVLTWSSSTNLDSADERTLSDLNLELINKAYGNVISRCYSYEDNHEVIDVENCELESNHEYSLEIVIDSLRFPTNPTRDYIKYSLGWVWVNDFAGKKIENDTIDIDTSFELSNRNIQCNNVVFENISTTSITADDKIELNPGVEIKEGAEFTAQIVKQVGKYDIGHKTYMDTIDTLEADFSGNFQTAKKYGSGQVDIIPNRYCQLDQARSLDGNVYYKLNKDTIFNHPEYFDGLTLRAWIRFYRGIDATGYIFTSMKDGDGYYLKVDDHGQYNKQLTFHISGGGASSTITSDILQNDLEGWIKYERPWYNWGWVHVTAVWRAGDEVAIFINGEKTPTAEPTNVEYCPSNQCFIGADSSISPLSFKGGIDEIRLYSGADSEEHIRAEYHKSNFPPWQGSFYPFILDVGYDGEVSYDVIYQDIEDVTPLDTVQENSIDSMVIPVPLEWRAFECGLNFIPYPGKILNHSSLLTLDKDGNIINKEDNYIIYVDTIVIDNRYKVEATFGDLVFIDDFETDKGWVTNPDNTDSADPPGTWSRDDPWNNKYHLDDVVGGGDTTILVTGYGGSGDHDVDNGVTSIRSPQIQLPSTGPININFSYYLLHDSTATNDDYLQVIIEGSTDSTVLDIKGTGEEKKQNNSDWETALLDISIYAGETITILIKAADYNNDNSLEAGIDYLVIVH